MKRKYYKYLTAALITTAASTAMAQSAVKQFPPGLKWETMGLLAFNFNSPGYQGTPAERKLAWSIWGPTIEKFPYSESFGDNKWPAFIILSAFESNTHRYVFSSMGAAAVAYPKCDDAINSSAPNTPIYTNCPLRIVVQDKKSGAAVQQDYPSFCHIATNDKDQPKSRNYAQATVNQDATVAYFRIVQYGKPVPECNRSIRLK